MRIKVCHLYPDIMNLYGDRGNLLVFYRRAQWRGIEVDVDQVLLGDQDQRHFTGYDFIFLGGGADSHRALVMKDLEKKGPFIIEAVEEGAVLLAVGLGFQVLGHCIRGDDGTEIPGAGVFDAYTEAGDSRLVGDILLDTAVEVQDEMKKTGGDIPFSNIIGFENHSGRTFLGEQVKPLGKVIKGKGNNGEDGTEGVHYNNAFGTFLHGPVLAKNPHLADLLIAKALSPKKDVSLDPLDDRLEAIAHNTMKKRLVR